MEEFIRRVTVAVVADVCVCVCVYERWANIISILLIFSMMHNVFVVIIIVAWWGLVSLLMLLLPYSYNFCPNLLKMHVLSKQRTNAAYQFLNVSFKIDYNAKNNISMFSEEESLNFGLWNYVYKIYKNIFIVWRFLWNELPYSNRLCK